MHVHCIVLTIQAFHYTYSINSIYTNLSTVSINNANVNCCSHRYC